MKYDGLIFDLDGTMWNATEPIRESWNLALKSFPELEGRTFSKEELQGVMGLPMDEIIAKLLPMLKREKQMEVLKKCCEVENLYLEKKGGILYPDLEEVLQRLKEECKLCIVSNGQSGYIQAFLKAHKLEKYFSDYQNWGDNQVRKGENIKNVIKRNKLHNPAYVGDTLGDYNETRYAGIDFIYAKYGFGNVKEKDCDYVLETFSDLLKIQ